MLSAVLALGLRRDFKLPPMEQVTLLIFMRGKSSKGMPAEQLETMQKGHIANLERLGKAHKAPCAGPFENGGDRRGLVVLTLPKDKVPQEFENDPFVKEGLLKLELHTWMVPKGLFAWPTLTKFEMGMFTFAWVSKGKNPKLPEPKDELAKHVEHNLGLMRDGRAALIGPFLDENPWALGGYIFNETDEAKINEWQKADPRIQSGRLEFHTLKLYMAKGLFKRLP
ncbi:MAG: hypothetical protein JST35_10905 [Armatimonadetes bacterium]|nr:hypothetical protein [Armatimonadota bacterium]